jgi:predicted ABC-type ATPase
MERALYIVFKVKLMPNLYIISGCNGAGKTTASFTILPEILECKEFVNADSIAAGISPFNPESVAIEAGRIMLKRIDELLNERADFALETTLSTRSYVPFLKKAQLSGYVVTLLYFWLSSPEMAYERVAKRVSEGGHNIPIDVIERRYYRGVKNLIELYIPICDKWLVMNNVGTTSEPVARKSPELGEIIINNDIWQTILEQSHDSSN